MVRFEGQDNGHFLLINWEEDLLNPEGGVEIVIAPCALPYTWDANWEGTFPVEDFDKIGSVIVWSKDFKATIEAASRNDFVETRLPVPPGCESQLVVRPLSQRGWVQLQVEELYPPYLGLAFPIAVAELDHRLFGGA